MKPERTVIAVAALMLLCSTAMAQRLPDGHARMLPGRVLARVTIHDTARDSERSHSPARQRHAELWSPFVEHLKAKRPQISERLRREVGLTLDEFRELGIGATTIASVRVPDRPVAIVAMIDFRSHFLMHRIGMRLTQALMVSGFTYRQSNYGRVCVYEFRREEKFRELAICVQGSTAYLTTDPGVLREMLCHCNTRSAVSHPRGYAEITATRQEQTHDPQLTWYVDPVGLLHEMILDNEPTESDFRSFLLNLIPQTGLDSLVAIGGTVEFRGQDYAAVSRTQVVLKEPREGLLGLVSLKTDNLEPPAWITSNATSCQSFFWDLQAFYDGANKLLSLIEGNNALDLYVKRLGTVKNGFNLKTDLLDQLTGRIRVVTADQDGNSHSVVAIQVRNPAAVDSVLQQADNGKPLFGTIPVSVSIVDGRTVYTQPVGETKVCLTLIDDMLVVAGSEQAIAASSGTAKTPLKESPGYQRVAAHLPMNCLMQSYDAANDSLRIPYMFLRSQVKPEDAFGIDLSLLPSFDDLRRTLGPSAAYAIENESGILVSQFSLYGQHTDDVAPDLAADATADRR
ncbi:hypothetical protein [Fuerstiella marisgermanici]|uniref:Uncharacterized protein n=1 Tax=Fuerstiella marisgermanici TaxID=1891926 RepID=A0A1P8WNG6_9PLAN|nr:hypothetical protein [Fuerstiella marisgermanici]APZ95591.1 hypothetical protein Fuma_05250 [Fuerstiella marisgermanici]